MTMDTTQTGSFLPQTVTFLSEQEMQKILDTVDDFEDEYEFVEEEKDNRADDIEEWNRVFAIIAEQNRARMSVPNFLERDSIETAYLKQKQKSREIPGWPSLSSSCKAARRSKFYLSTEELQRLEHELPIEEQKTYYYSDEDEDDFDQWNRVFAKYAQWNRARNYLERGETVETEHQEPSGETDEWPTLSCGLRRPLSLYEYFVPECFLLTGKRKILETEDPEEEPRNQKGGETDDRDDDYYDEYDREYTSFAQPVRTRREKYLLPVY